jgi:hypothetical protein
VLLKGGLSNVEGERLVGADEQVLIECGTAGEWLCQRALALPAFLYHLFVGEWEGSVPGYSHLEAAIPFGIMERVL